MAAYLGPDAITPCRSSISDRFPIASFSIRTTPRRFYEVACATDPRLFHTDQAPRRTTRNFFTSRGEGLLRADDAQTAWIVPPQALKRFAGAQRLYFALGTYGGPQGADPRFTISPSALDRIPSIALAGDFTGRTLERSGIGYVEKATAAYGGSPGAPLLRWGGDDLYEALQAGGDASSNDRYDDGYGGELWAGLGEVLVDGASDGEVEDGAAANLSEGQARASSFGEPELEDAVDATRSMAQAAPLETMQDDELEDGVDASLRAAAAGYSHAKGGRDAPGRGTTEQLAWGGDFADDEEGLEDGASILEGTSTWSLGDHNGDYQESFDHPGPEYDGDGGYGVEQSHGYGMAVYGRREASTDSAPGRYADYREHDEEEALSVGPAARALSGALDATELDVTEKVRLLRRIARAESGDAGYSAVLADPEFNDPRHPAFQSLHMGLSWGLLAFPQRTGLLGQVLRRAKAREEDLRRSGGLSPDHSLERLFGPAWRQLCEITDPEVTRSAEDRVAPVEGSVLWEEPWLTRFRAAGEVPYVRAAQNEVGVTQLFDPMLPIARGLGLDTPRALAILVDRAVHMGVGAARSWVMSAIGPVRSESDRDQVLRALGHEPGDLREFQRVRGLEADNRWGPLTHAAMAGAVRALGSAAPIQVAPTPVLLAALVREADATSFGNRVRALHDDRESFDDHVRYLLD